MTGPTPAASPTPATTPWVPLWDLNGGVALTYYGDYVAGSYKDGDIVVYNGVAYLCVRPTSTAPAAWPRSQAVSSYATTLPASPYDGQEAVLVDSVTNPSYIWRFRYNAGGGTYKWEFVGGTHARDENAAQQATTTVATWLDLATVGPRVILPRAGEYDAIGGSAFLHSAAGAWAFNGLARNATDPSGGNYAAALTTPVANYPVALPTVSARIAVNAGDDIRLRYNTQSAGTTTWQYRWIRVWPVRVA